MNSSPVVSICHLRQHHYFGNILKVLAELDGGGAAIAELRDDLVPRMEDIAKLHRIEALSLVAWNTLLLYLFVLRNESNVFTGR